MTDRIEVLTQRPTERTGHEGQTRHHATPRRGSNTWTPYRTRRITSPDGSVTAVHQRPNRRLRGTHSVVGCATPSKLAGSDVCKSRVRRAAAAAEDLSLIPRRDQLAQPESWSLRYALISRRLLVGFGRRVARADCLTCCEQIPNLIGSQPWNGIAPLIDGFARDSERFSQGSNRVIEILDRVFCSHHAAHSKHASAFESSMFSKHSYNLR
jgi:hypothetical protein